MINLTKRNRVLATATALLLVAGPMLVPAGSAAADDTPVCGLQLTGAQPGQDPIAALDDLLNEGQDAEFGVAEGILNVGSEICGPAETALKIGARFALGGVETDLFDIELSEQQHALVAVVEQLLEGNQLDSLPGSDASNVPAASSTTATVFNTGGVGLNVEDMPLGNVETTLPDGTSVEVLCQQIGPAEEDGLGSDELWDYIAFSGTTGFASDAWLDTATNDQVAPTCGG